MTVWILPDPPDGDTTVVFDRSGTPWQRDDGNPDLWWGNVGHTYDDVRSWPDLLRRGPITTREN